MTRLRWDVFIAHAGAERNRAEALYDLLPADLSVFLDTRSVRIGDDWDLVIADALHSTRIIALLIPKVFEPAYYLREEIAVAIALARQDPDGHRVVPIYLDTMENVPYGLRIKHSLDAKVLGLAGVGKELEDLARSLRAKELPPPPEPTDADRAGLRQQIAGADQSTTDSKRVPK